VVELVVERRVELEGVDVVGDEGVLNEVVVELEGDVEELEVTIIIVVGLEGDVVELPRPTPIV